MPDDWQVLLLRFIENGEIGISRQAVVHLDAVRALLLQRNYGSPCLIRSSHRDSELRIGPGVRAINDWSASHNLRSQLLTLGDCVAQRKYLFGDSAHVASPENTIGNVHL